MLAATRPNPGKRKVSKAITLPAPTNGWFVGDNLAAAPPQTAYVMDNFFPGQNYVRLRRGSTEYATGMTDVVPRLMVYDNGTASQMFAANGSSIYDVSVTGAVGAADVTGLTSTDWSYVQFTTTGGTFLRLVNGADTPQVFDGSTWGTTPAITGATAADLIHVWAYRNRLYFVEKTSMSAWYLPVDSIGGAAVEFPLGGVFTLGGELLIGASWSANLNNSTNELCVFITSQGEVAVYGGAYPGGTDWSIQGLYRIGKPLGRNCIFKAGGDLAIMTEDGIVPMSKVVSLDRVALANEAITQPIQPAWLSAVTARTALDGWSITVWPLESMAVVNVPQLDANDKQQFVANARSGAWCRYTGWDARSFAVYNNRLYFGTSDGRVMRGESTGQDDGSLYSGKLVWSYNDFKAGPMRKQVKAVRPLYRTTFNAIPSFGMLADYSVLTTPAPSAAAESTSGALWDVAVWDVDLWPGTSTQKASWKVVTGFGAVLAPVMQVSVSSANDPELDMLQMDVLYELGEAIG